MSLAEN